ncbi:hypothetical protein [Bradyrhizobium zhanjiangense]|uniref:Uncharacterized protein n=1 Tax=Bradyrhizobium zhanjiangense TaxID=1325107 RepID=A0A4Q0RWJ0_9BRAD|nr:hypothetical protein [Bradyrhizobium zhanjiangense]RXH23636.1 hypothetical protein XH94_36635 [Bradyrhizobium zhanjiangense]
MVIKPLAITYIQTSQNWRFSIELFESLFPDTFGAGRTSAGLSTVYQFAAAQVLRALTAAQSLPLVGRRSIPLLHLRERPQPNAKMLTEREPMVLHSTKSSCSPDE